MESTLTFRDTVSEVEKHYPFNTEITVANFLEEYPYLINILSKAIEIIVSYFSNEALSLVVAQDPQHDSFSKLSIIIVQTSLSPAIALQKLSDIDEEFLQNHIPSDLLVHVEFQ